MKKNLVPLLGIAFVVAIASTGIFYGLFVNKLRSPRGPQKTLVVAARDLKKGLVLKDTDLKTMPWGGDALPPGTYGTIQAAAGTTVIESMRENEPVLRERVISNDGGKDSELGIPTGMRAVSVHVADSTGVLGLIRRGYKVDVQVVRARNGNPGEADVRTVLENVPVLAVGAAEPGGAGFAAPVVTVLARPEQVDVLAVADSAARIRLALRNPLDDATLHPRELSLAAVFRGGGAPGGHTGASQAGISTGPRGEIMPPRELGRTISLSVLIAAVSRDNMGEINAQLVAPSRNGWLQLSSFRPDSDPEAAVRQLEERHLIGVISKARLTAGLGREVSMQAGIYADAAEAAKDPVSTGGIRVKFFPFIAPDGKMHLRVSPEVAAPNGGRIVVHRAATEADLTDGRDFLVSGLAGDEDTTALLTSLFAGRQPPRGSNLELLVFVAPGMNGPVRTAALR